jgi:hypothetical protein
MHSQRAVSVSVSSVLIWPRYIWWKVRSINLPSESNSTPCCPYLQLQNSYAKELLYVAFPGMLWPQIFAWRSDVADMYAWQVVWDRRCRWSMKRGMIMKSQTPGTCCNIHVCDMTLQSCSPDDLLIHHCSTNKISGLGRNLRNYPSLMESTFPGSGVIVFFINFLEYYPHFRAIHT